MENFKDGEFIILTTDFGFKRIFGSEKRKGLLIRFLNALFEGELVVEDVRFRDKEVLPLEGIHKRIIYDIYCVEEKDGERHHFVIEMQQINEPFFPSRALFYTTSAMINQGLKGKAYSFDPVIGIFVTGFTPDRLPKSMIHDVRLMDVTTDTLYGDDIRMIFLSLPQVPDSWNKCETELQRLLYLVRNMGEMTRNSEPYASGRYNDFFEASETGSLRPDEMVTYHNSVLYQQSLKLSETKAEERGKEIGEKLGMEKTKNSIAKEMKAMGFDTATIIKLTGIDPS